MDNERRSSNMIDTQRLTIRPLDRGHLWLWQKSLAALSKRLDCAKCPYLDQDTENIVQRLLKVVCRRIDLDPKRYIWHTLWPVILKSEECIVASICFNGPPQEEGEVKISYLVFPQYRGYGFATEALTGAIGWAFKQDDVMKVSAEIDQSNDASRRVLEKLGMRRINTVITNETWTIRKEDR